MKGIVYRIEFGEKAEMLMDFSGWTDEQIQCRTEAALEAADDHLRVSMECTAELDRRRKIKEGVNDCRLRNLSARLE